jgi:tetratricopeptide (TPR) repeat protein
MPLYEVGLGAYQRRISNTNEQTQAYFTQGVQLLFSFTPEDAARSFREAQKRDSTCVMCYWGEAIAWGPYLNGDMARDDAPRAFYAAQRAKHFAGSYGTPVERALADAITTRYSIAHDPETREQLDTVYAHAMEAVWELHPSDLDVGTFYAEALMLLEPRRGNWDTAKPSVQRIHAILEHVLAGDITHPGACHLYIHATESTAMPGKAEACADHLGHAIPGASHINHMPSHTYNRVGRWADAVRANLDAWHSDQKAEIGQGFAIYPSHNLHMLLFSASWGGQGAIAVQAARDYARIVNNGTFYEALALFRFGRFDEVLALDDPPQGNPVFRGLWDFARGYAHLRKGDSDSAAAYLARVHDNARAGADSIQFRGHTASDLLTIAGNILQGEIARTNRRTEEAIDLFEGAVRIEDALRYDEPEPLNFSARHWLGSALLDAGRPADAERVFRTELEDHPNNGWSLIGLQLALQAQNRDAQADQVRADFARAWAHSDTWIRQPHF